MGKTYKWIAIIAAIITIFVFVTGNTNLKDTLNSLNVDEAENVVNENDEKSNIRILYDWNKIHWWKVAIICVLLFFILVSDFIDDNIFNNEGAFALIPFLVFFISIISKIVSSFS